MTRPPTNRTPSDGDCQSQCLRATIHGLLDQVSHDFRTPITVIKEFATLMRDELVGPVSARQSDFLDIINDRADDLTLIVDNVIDAGKCESGVLRAWRRSTDVAELIRAAEASLARKATIRHIRLDVAVGPDLPEVSADREQLIRALVNLATAAMGCIERPERIRLAAWGDPGQSDVTIEVAVEGEADLADVLDAVAEATDPARPSDVCCARGVAWRAALARRLVQLHFGQTQLQRTSDGSVAFQLTLPVNNPRAVLDAYLRNASTGNEHHENLASAIVDTDVEPTVAGVVDEFLQSAVGPADLVVRLDRRQWLLVLAADEPSMPAMLSRIGTAWSETLEGRHGNLLPRLEMADLGPRNPADGADDLIARFETQTAAV